VLFIGTAAVLVRSTATTERALWDEYRKEIVRVASETSNLLDEVLRTQALLSGNNDLIDFFVTLEPFPRRKQYRPLSAANSLSVFQQSRDVIVGAYIYQRSWDRVLTGGGLIAPELYFTEVGHYADYDLRFWEELTATPDGRPLVLPPTRRVATAVRTVVPVVSFRIGMFVSRNPFVVDLDSAWLTDYLSARKLTPNSVIAAFSEDGDLLMRSEGGSLPTDQDRGLWVEHATTAPRLEGIRYVGYVPAPDIAQSARQNLWIGLGIVAAALAAALLSALAIAERIYSPIRQLVSLVSDPAKGTPGAAASGEYDYLRAKITSMLDRNREMEGELRSAVPVVFELYLIRLLNRGPETETRHLRSFLARHDLQFHEPLFLVSVIQMHMKGGSGAVASDSGTGAVYKLLISRVQQLCRSHILVLDSTRLAVVTNFQTEATGRQVAERIALLPQIFSSDVSVESFVGGLGRIHPEIEGLCESYDEALAALAVANPYEFDVTTFDDAVERGRRFVYTIEDETRIYNLLTSGDTPALIEHLHTIVDRNAGPATGREAMRELYVQLYYTALRVLYSRNARPEDVMGEEFVPVEILSHKNTGVQEIFSYITRFFRRVSQHNRNHGQSRIEVGELMRYVNEHSAEPIYLGSLAEYFGSTEKYISRLFKEQAGVAFHEYLSTIRVNRARELLAGTSLQVSEVFRRCGFTSRNTFMRTFKKYVGETPTEYRRGRRAGQATS
jgi:transcriptional regulator GlxA family with amidase domain